MVDVEKSGGSVLESSALSGRGVVVRLATKAELAVLVLVLVAAVVGV